jgi:hypothetical protein
MELCTAIPVLTDNGNAGTLTGQQIWSVKHRFQLLRL